MAKAYLILGGNIGDVQKHFDKALHLIEEKIGKITGRSAIYRTAAWGYEQQPDFLNIVVKIKTGLSAETLMLACLEIEKKLGRKREFKNAPRTIDIDILFYDKQIIQTETLQVPHPRIAERKFVLIPLNELSPNLKHPVLKKTIHQLLTDCTDGLEVSKI